MKYILPIFLTLLFITSCYKKKEGVYFKEKAKKYIHLQKASFYIKEGNYSLAEKELVSAIKIDPNDYNAWLLLGNVYDKMNEDKKAINAYIVGIRLKKKDEKMGASSLRNPYKSMWKGKYSSKP